MPPDTLVRAFRYLLSTRRVKDEMRDNLVLRLRQEGPLFPGIVGYENTVIPQVVNAILSRHDMLFLGLRGQAHQGEHLLRPDGEARPAQVAQRPERVEVLPGGEGRDVGAGPLADPGPIGDRVGPARCRRRRGL